MTSTPTSSSSPARPAAQSDADLLRELGYEQELHRSMSGFSNFAVSFSIISVLAGCITSYAPIAVLTVLMLATVTWFAGGKKKFMLGRPIAPALSKVPDPTSGA